MTDLVTCHPEDLPGGEVVFRISMQAPRANALEPQILAELHQAFDALQRSGIQKAVISGGRHFSTGGDVARFYEAAKAGQAERYSDKVVPQLQSLVLRMLEMPVVFAAAVRGAVTGGSAGLLFAADLAVATSDAFVQPYYSDMGFAPDGGWASLLPELVGGAVARSWLLANHRMGADQLQQLGVLASIRPDPEAHACHLLSQVDTATALTAKAILWHDARLALVKTGLEAEATAFRKLIGRPQTQARMRSFLHNNG